MYDPKNLWSDEEDDAIREFYPRHGAKWDGWSEVLPKRTPRAIGARANRLGIKMPVAEPKPKPERRRRKERKEIVIPDPYEGYVVRCMHDGVAPSVIDASMRWASGTAVQIMVDMWKRIAEE